jgi:hypothetical protein
MRMSDPAKVFGLLVIAGAAVLAVMALILILCAVAAIARAAGDQTPGGYVGAAVVVGVAIAIVAGLYTLHWSVGAVGTVAALALLAKAAPRDPLSGS